MTRVALTPARVGGVTSKLPASQRALPGRRAPRWSVAAQAAPEAGTTSIAALPASSRRVCVGPPLDAGGASFGSPTAAPGQVASPNATSWPPSVVAAHWFGALLAMIEFLSVPPRAPPPV